MAAIKKIDLDNYVVPSFVRKIVKGTKKNALKMSTSRLEKLMDLEIEEKQGSFAMPQPLEEPMVIHFTGPHLSNSTPEDQGVQEKKEEEVIQKHQQKKQQQKRAIRDLQKQQKQQKPMVHQLPPQPINYVPEVFHTEYGHWNRFLVPVHHHVRFVPQYQL